MTDHPMIDGLIDAEETVVMPEYDERCYSSVPNPHLTEWVHDNCSPYDAKKDRYEVSDFTEQVSATKATSIYNMHSYHAGKKPHDFIRHYIRHYTNPGDIVLDPMSGSGSTALAALLENRKTVAVDISPAATFIAKNYCWPVNPTALKQAFAEVKKKVKPEIDWLYETRCSRCGGKAITNYTVYSQVFKCPRCWESVPLYDCEVREGISKNGKAQKTSHCPHCHEVISTTSDEKVGARPVAVAVTCLESKKPECKESPTEFRSHNDDDLSKRKYFHEKDLGKIAAIESRPIDFWYPTDRMMHAPEHQNKWGVKWRAGTSNFRTVDELYTKRNLWALAAWMDAANSICNDNIRFAVVSLTLGLSKMCRFDPAWSFPFPIMSGTYYIPQIFKEMNAFSGVVSKFERTMMRGWTQIATSMRATHHESDQVMISTQSGTDLSSMPDNSVDYIFTDPPYADRVQYGELNFIWESWLRFDTHWHDKEVIVNSVRGKTADDWKEMMSAVMRECFRVMKPGRALSLCYHDTSEGTWAMLQDIMLDAGFFPESTEAALVIDTGQKSYNQTVADSVLKRDLVLSFRKPKPNQRRLPFTVRIGGANIEEKVQEAIRLFLTTYPGYPKDAIYDAVISMLVQDQQMKVHDFEEQLRIVAEPNDAGEWFLKNGENEVIPPNELEKEAQAAQAIREFIARLEQEQERLGAAYGDIFEFYVAEYRGSRPQRLLQDILPDWFYPAPGGGYRNPANDEERNAKEAGRQSGVNRDIRRFLKHPGHSPSPDQKTMIGWLSHCLSAGLYEEGRELFERGVIDLSILTEIDRVTVEDNYEMCKLRLRRRVEQLAEEKPRRRVATKAKTSDGQETLAI